MDARMHTCTHARTHARTHSTYTHTRTRRRLAGEDYTSHIEPALLRSIIEAYAAARAGPQPLCMPKAKMMQIAQYCAALPWMIGVARKADCMQSAFVQCGFRDVPGGARPSLVGILNTLVRARVQHCENE